MANVDVHLRCSDIPDFKFNDFWKDVNGRHHVDFDANGVLEFQVQGEVGINILLANKAQLPNDPTEDTANALEMFIGGKAEPVIYAAPCAGCAPDQDSIVGIAEFPLIIADQYTDVWIKTENGVVKVGRGPYVNDSTGLAFTKDFGSDAASIGIDEAVFNFGYGDIECAPDIGQPTNAPTEWRMHLHFTPQQDIEEINLENYVYPFSDNSIDNVKGFPAQLRFNAKVFKTTESKPAGTTNYLYGKGTVVYLLKQGDCTTDNTETSCAGMDTLLTESGFEKRSGIVKIGTSSASFTAYEIYTKFLNMEAVEITNSNTVEDQIGVWLWMPGHYPEMSFDVSPTQTIERVTFSVGLTAFNDRSYTWRSIPNDLIRPGVEQFKSTTRFPAGTTSTFKGTGTLVYIAHQSCRRKSPDYHQYCAGMGTVLANKGFTLETGKYVKMEAEYWGIYHRYLDNEEISITNNNLANRASDSNYDQVGAWVWFPGEYVEA